MIEPQFRGELAGMLLIIVLLHSPTGLKLQGMNWLPNILLQDFVVEGRIHGSINYGNLSRSWSRKAAPNHHSTAIIFDCWYVLFVKCCVHLMPDAMGLKPFFFKSVFFSPAHRIYVGNPEDASDKFETSLYLLFGQKWLFPYGHICPFSFLFLNHDHWP